MSYHLSMGEARVSYHLSMGGITALPGVFPGMLPGPMPGPFSPGFIPGAPGPPPVIAGGVSIFPTSFREGDVVTVMGPFAGKFQGQVVVRLQGVRGGIAISMTGRHGGSFVVPEGAETGSCTVEVDGRQVYGTNCVVTKNRVSLQEPKGQKSWKNFGPLSDFDTPSLLKWGLIAAGGYLAWRHLKRRGRR